MHATVADARAWALEKFKRARVQSPEISADLLLGLVLGWDRVRVLSYREEVLADEDWIRFQELVSRRLKGEPLQYLRGEQEFFGLSFEVSPDVLIPRPETEILAEKAINLIRKDFPSRCRLLDVGTGSGCIAITIAHEVPSSIPVATDISMSALRIACRNAARHGACVQFIQSDLLRCFPSRPCFDFILSNPPYVALQECDTLPSEVRNYEPHGALFGGNSGMEIYDRLIPEAAPRLATGGFLLVEAGAGQAERIGRIIEGAGLALEEVVDDLHGIPRCLVGRKLQKING
jgi:release factor glutamine methyltransferase